MKRYALFAGDQYYPSGGWDDFIGTYDSVEDALEAEAKRTRHDWYQIVDLTTGEQVNE